MCKLPGKENAMKKSAFCWLRIRHAFTLIELLIVVAIIAILAAIAVPNFLEAQVRAKASRVKNDLRTIVTGCEAYNVDWNKYPPTAFPGRPIGTGGDSSCFVQWVTTLTSPISYLTSVELRDPFGPTPNTAFNNIWQPVNYHGTYQYEFFWSTNWGQMASQHPEAYAQFNGCSIMSFGPDKDSDGLDIYPSCIAAGWPQIMGIVYQLVYDSTNGTISNGDIARYCGPGMPMMGY
jgi:prepilin-type N-terminal cleavage/methylation domain-containing protein